MGEVQMTYEEFINELKNIPTIKEKQDALDAINLSSKILFDINEKALESHPQKTSNDLRKELFKTKNELAIKKEQMQEINRYLGHLYLSLQIELMTHEDGNANPYETHIIISTPVIETGKTIFLLKYSCDLGYTTSPIYYPLVFNFPSFVFLLFSTKSNHFYIRFPN